MAEERQKTPFERIGGGETVSAIVFRFYELMDSDPAYAALRGLHAQDLSGVREGLTQFLGAWLGGPRDWFARGQCVMSLHRGFPITPDIADQWAQAMARAIDEQDSIEPALSELMIRRLGEMARAMTNSGEAADAA